MGIEAMSEVEPDRERLASVHEASLDNARRSLDRYEGMPEGLEKLAALKYLGLSYYRLGDTERAELLSREALAAAGQHPGEFFVADLVHYGHTTLGLLALDRGDIPGACQHLAESVDGTSPVLRSFGPCTQLAMKLLEAGEDDAVLAYFTALRTQWTSGGAFLDIWEEKIRAGKIPVFMMHSYR